MCEICNLENLTQAQPSRRGLLRFFGVAAAGLALSGSAVAKGIKAPPKSQNVVSPDASLELLMKGNDRYVEGVSRRHDFKQEREALVGGQNPYAGILSCADSRIAPEYAFDSGRGDLFVCRVAGNFANSDTIASMEYAVAMLGTPLIMVLGHDTCGAVGATMKSLKDNIALPGHTLLGHKPRPRSECNFGPARRSARQRHPSKRDRQRGKTQICKSDSQRGYRTAEAQGGWRHLPAQRWKNRNDLIMRLQARSGITGAHQAVQ